jgi:DNA polymerase III delta subunit
MPKDLANDGFISIRVSAREFDTILAALRLYQEHEPGEIRTEVQEMASEHGKALTNEEIDALCERINNE